MLRGFTHTSSYFGVDGRSDSLALHSVDEFTELMNTLLDITMKSRLVEKLANALHEVRFGSVRFGSEHRSSPHHILAASQTVERDGSAVSCGAEGPGASSSSSS